MSNSLHKQLNFWYRVSLHVLWGEWGGGYLPFLSLHKCFKALAYVTTGNLYFGKMLLGQEVVAHISMRVFSFSKTGAKFQKPKFCHRILTTTVHFLEQKLQREILMYFKCICNWLSTKCHQVKKSWHTLEREFSVFQKLAQSLKSKNFVIIF